MRTTNKQRPSAIAAIAAVLASPTLLGAEPSPVVVEEPETRKEEIELLRAKKSVELEPDKPPSLERKLLFLKERQILQRLGFNLGGVFPKVGGVETGQGFGLGVQYRRDFGPRNDFQLLASGIGSFAGAFRHDLQLRAPELKDGLLGLDFTASQRNLSQVDFYGLGPDSSRSDRTSYRLEDLAFDGKLTLRPFRNWFALGAKVGALDVNTGAGSRRGIASTETVFSPGQIPGLADQTNFLRYGGFVSADTRDNPSLARSGSLVRADFTYYDDRGLGRHDFRKFELEGQHYIGFFNKRRVIALRARAEFNYTNGDQSVPFYLKPWIGGPQELRGFRNYRFYDDNVLVMNAEYRWEAFSGLDMALFFDAGQVAARRQDFSLSKMESAAGVGFRFNVRNTTFMRLDFAFSHEGAKIWLRYGSPF